MDITNTSVLTDNELLALCDVMNGHLWGSELDKNYDYPRREILANLEDTLNGLGLCDDLPAKWNIDGEKLLSTLKQCSDDEINIIKKNILAFWADK